MTIQQVYDKMLGQLQAVYESREAANITNMVLEHFTGKKKIDRITEKDAEIMDDQCIKLEEALHYLIQHKPVQYVLEECWFAGLSFYVNEHVLIPRPETEELVDWIVTSRKADVDNKVQERERRLSIIDIGTGSGCIPVTIKKHLPSADVMAIDVSSSALQVAARNAKQHCVDIQFAELNFLDKKERDQLGTFDLIISNPPYIRQSEEQTMEQNVLAHEPHIALFVPDENALVFYEAIADFGQEHLTGKGSIYLEINEALGYAVAELYKRKGFTDVEIKKDMQGKDRMVKVNGMGV
jgi:release factor glutamine methyltransferase